MQEYITGIQQVGIGVADVAEAKHLYKDLFGMNVLIFEDKAEASLMANYTGSNIHHRHAILTLNMAGGGGFELWQFTSRQPQKPAIPARLGDLGIFAIKIKTKNVDEAYRHFKKIPGVKVSQLLDAPLSGKHFWLTDGYGNNFNIIKGHEWFKSGNSLCGGVAGAVIGVSDMEASMHFYKKVLGINEELYNVTGYINDAPLNEVPAQVYNRVILKKEVATCGAFSKLLGSVQIELIQAKERVAEKIYANRFWGDCGFIHLCFDVMNMDALKNISAKAGFPFSIDSANSFTMGASAGRFCYVEDPDGTLIELVETHKVPIVKKLGLHLNLKKRKADKPLPDWMIGMMGLNKIK
ncbi:MAG: VOC family protein [Ferruginibacter sp.]